MFNIEKIKEIVKSGFSLNTKSGEVFKSNIKKLLPLKKELPTPKEVREEIKKNRNHSWIRETIRDNNLADKVFDALENNINKGEFIKIFPELDYVQYNYLVDTQITKAEFIYESYKLAKGLKAQGFSNEDELYGFVDRTPEYTYLIGAASILGTTVNLICEKFDHNYIKSNIIYHWDDRMTKEQIKYAEDNNIYPNTQEYDEYLKQLGIDAINCKKFVFYQDVKKGKIKDIINDLDEVLFIETPFDRSAKDLTTYDKYIKNYYPRNHDEFMAPNIINYNCLIDNSNNYKDRVENPSTLDDILTVTYSSGTTGNPKGICHNNRHYITMARYHDTEVSGIPDIKNLSTYCNIPSYSNSYVLSVLSDNTIKGGLVKLDPVDEMDYFPIGLRINEGNMNIASVSAWNLLALNSLAYPEKYKDYKIPYAIFNFAVGEELQPGEEKMDNKALRKFRAGTKFKTKNGKEIKLPVSIARMCTAGGACEFGSNFIRLMRSLYNNTPRKIKKDPIGMNYYDFIDVKILREDGSYANPYEIGRVTVNSDCNMVKYNHDPKNTEDFYIVDKYGIKRGDMKVWGYLDENNNLTIKDRIKEPLFQQKEINITDAIVKDTKNICSVKVVKNIDNGYTAFILFQPGISNTKKAKAIQSARYRVLDECGIDINFIEKNLDNYFPLTKSLKIDKKKLKEEANYLKGNKSKTFIKL